MNKPMIRIARDHRSCGCCDAANYESSFYKTKKVDVIFEIVVGNLVSAMCPDCLRSLRDTAFTFLNGYAPSPEDKARNEDAESSCQVETAEEVNICPVCGGPIEPEDVGDDDGYCEMYLHWECERCGTKGKAVYQTEHEFVYHEYESKSDEEDE